MKYVLHMRCQNGHVTHTEILSPIVKDGVLVNGYCGSAADFCSECDELIVENLQITAI
jgi:hypothetical protein